MATRQPTTGEAQVSTAAAAATVANPGPVGLAAFAMTTFVLSCFNAHFINANVESVVLPLALFYGGAVQLLAGMWEFRRNNTFAATAFSSFGAFWLSFAAYVKFVVPSIAASGHEYQATGVYLLAWAIFTGYMTVAALRTTAATFSVFLFLTLTFVILTIGAFGQSTGWEKLGGWFGLITAALAWYTSWAEVTATTFGRYVLPVWPLRGPAPLER
jgi:succinate-acetate transporter protein